MNPVYEIADREKRRIDLRYYYNGSVASVVVEPHPTWDAALSHNDTCLCSLCTAFVIHEISESEVTSDSTLRAWE